MIRIIRENIEDEFDEFDFGDEKSPWVTEVPNDCIKGATLLSDEEYKEYKDNIPKIEAFWWLRSPCYYSSCAKQVDFTGLLDHGGDDVSYPDNGIRPALILDSKDSELPIGDKLCFGEHTFTIISQNLAICDGFIGMGCFQKNKFLKDANDYEKSDVKKVVDDWFNSAKK